MWHRTHHSPSDLSRARLEAALSPRRRARAVLVTLALAAALVVALAACEGGSTAPAAYGPDCSSSQDVTHGGDSTFTFTWWYPDTSAVCLAQRRAG